MYFGSGRSQVFVGFDITQLQLAVLVLPAVVPDLVAEVAAWMWSFSCT